MSFSNWWWTCNVTICPNQVTVLLISLSIVLIGLWILANRYGKKGDEKC